MAGTNTIAIDPPGVFIKLELEGSWLVAAGSRFHFRADRATVESVAIRKAGYHARYVAVTWRRFRCIPSVLSESPKSI